MTAASTGRFAVIPAVYVYLRRGDDVLLQLRAGTGYMDGMWAAGAAGHIEPGETARAAALREAGEELGVAVDAGALTPLTVMQRTDGTTAAIEQRADWFFTASEWTGTPSIREPGKCAGLTWFALDALPAAMPAYERQVLNGLAAGSLPLFSDFGFTADAGIHPADASALEKGTAR
ncbi:hypothetical protein GCM10025768_02090 [Microbacterium pseudoresistens]|uniref:8-oxo-dGTP pyrophosphatase MutT (NUDIX family) n=1 Tax=Microbacterium pseudoresistens TaxID=640634 RepID=A0A7Y9EU70_9MICO|nr:NUDIX domain-containing protein [Microbacterium pseudoresistens]NYD54044.1 8-oxo-dGTP pyrophosphatase MutT (NUDIX family) [Microbacterium pseudoresistens]